MLGLTNRIEGKVLAVIAEKLSAREQMLTPRMDFRRDLGADLLAMIEFVLLREATFDVDIPHEDLAQISTVQQVVNYLKEIEVGLHH